GPDGAKLSKRHGAQSVVEFREMGFLPEALCNYLLRLGWGHGNAEVLSREEAIRLFDIGGVGRAAARMDYAKLTHLNAVWLRRADDERLTNDVVERLGTPAEPVQEAIVRLMPALKERARTLMELAQSAKFLTLTLPLPMEAKAAALLTAEKRRMLAALAARLAEADFAPPALDTVLREFAAAKGEKLGAVAQPLRAALTGSVASPPIDQVAASLGRDETLARIAAVVGAPVS
ncbi:MAG: glutamate--tRNA ligase family protein, partial [Acetobacteraceae bacterium]